MILSDLLGNKEIYFDDEFPTNNPLYKYIIKIINEVTFSIKKEKFLDFFNFMNFFIWIKK